jgi:hypothetical protein
MDKADRSVKQDRSILNIAKNFRIFSLPPAKRKTLQQQVRTDPSGWIYFSEALWNAVVWGK